MRIEDFATLNHLPQVCGGSVHGNLGDKLTCTKCQTEMRYLVSEEDCELAEIDAVDLSASEENAFSLGWQAGADKLSPSKPKFRNPYDEQLQSELYRVWDRAREHSLLAYYLLNQLRLDYCDEIATRTRRQLLLLRERAVERHAHFEMGLGL